MTWWRSGGSGCLIAMAAATDRSAVWLVCLGFVLPFLVWNGLIGFVV